jgi:hypothetical protein
MYGSIKNQLKEELAKIESLGIFLKRSALLSAHKVQAF